VAERDDITRTDASALSLLVEWANNQDHWIRALTAEVLETRRPISDGRAQHFLNLLLQEKELAAGQIVAVPLLRAADGVVTASAPLSLKRLDHRENVNALASNQQVEFNPRMTILFGENASGKTGYVRVLKRAAAVRTAEAILPDIRSGGSSAAPHVLLEYRLGEQDQPSIEWHGEQGVDPFTRIDVFDSRAAAVHLDDDLTYAYTPGDLELFHLAHDGVEKVHSLLDAAQRDRQPGGNPFLARFPKNSRLLPKVEALGPSTDLSAFEEIAAVSEEDKLALPALRETVMALRSGNVEARIQALVREQKVYGRAAGLADVLTRFDLEAYEGARLTLGDAESAQVRATQEAFAADALPGVLGDEWRAFIEAAEAYIRGSGREPYPAEGERCVYCRQPLGEAAIALLHKYREFCNDALRAAVDDARKRLDTLTEAVVGSDPDGLQSDLDLLFDALNEEEVVPAALQTARAVTETARAIHRSIQTRQTCPPASLDAGEAWGALSAHVEALRIAEADLRKKGAEREQALADASTKLRDLEDRLTLREILPAVRTHVDAARWADRAGAQVKRFQGIKKSLTETSKRASASALHADFERRFEQECEALRAPRVRLAFPGREGEARRRKLLTAEHGLGEVLSEGEQKVVALADFLAEASLKRDSSPLVVDDPVTSLDHKRLQHVVGRLVTLSADRQVIVFTHDIWFAAEILARFERSPRECSFYDVTAEDGRIGAITRGSSPRTDSFNDRKKRLNRLIEEASKATGEVRAALVEKGFEELRGACELVAEKDLLKGVTERYRPNVRMTVLDQIQADRLPAAISEIVPIFERACREIASHSQPLATLGVRATLEDLRQDWDALRQAREQYLK